MRRLGSVNGTGCVPGMLRGPESRDSIGLPLIRFSRHVQGYTITSLPPQSQFGYLLDSFLI